MLEYAGSQRSGLAAQRGEGLAVVSLLRSLDWLLLAGVAGLVAVGLWGIAGVTRFDVTGNPSYYVDRQMVYAAVGAVALVIGILVDPDLYRRYWRYIFGGTVGLIAVVLLVGRAARGSTRWINVGFFTFQPSEFGKLLFVLALAGFLADRRPGRRRRHDAAHARARPGAGRARVRAARPRHGARLPRRARRDALRLRDAVAAARRARLARGAARRRRPLGRPGRRRRLPQGLPEVAPDVLRAPVPVQPATPRYNLEQSIAAVGSGQVNGRGVKNATQTRLNFLPEHGTDFVFASYSEQRGFVGASLLLALYLLVLWRGLRVVAVARDLYSAVVAGGIVVALLFQIFVNVGMTMGIAPITGIPLPFVSVGGSSMIANLAAMGILLAIHARGRAARSRRRS